MKPAIRALLLLAPIVAVGCGRSARTTPQPPAATSPGTEAAAPASGNSAAAPAPAAAAAPTLPLPDLGYNAREGRVVFLHYCVTCHGAEGHGDGFNAYNLDPKPRDLGDAAFQAKHTDEELAAVVRTGGGAAGLSTAMPPWGRTLSERQIKNLLAYVRTLKPAQ